MLPHVAMAPNTIVHNPLAQGEHLTTLELPTVIDLQETFVLYHRSGSPTASIYRGAVVSKERGEAVYPPLSAMHVEIPYGEGLGALIEDLAPESMGYTHGLYPETKVMEVPQLEAVVRSVDLPLPGRELPESGLQSTWIMYLGRQIASPTHIMHPETGKVIWYLPGEPGEAGYYPMPEKYQVWKRPPEWLALKARQQLMVPLIPHPNEQETYLWKFAGEVYIHSGKNPVMSQPKALVARLHSGLMDMEQIYGEHQVVRDLSKGIVIMATANSHTGIDLGEPAYRWILTRDGEAIPGGTGLTGSSGQEFYAAIKTHLPADVWDRMWLPECSPSPVGPTVGIPLDDFTDREAVVAALHKHFPGFSE